MVEFGLLGEVEVRLDGRSINVGHARQQCVLIALAVDANKVVPVDQLLDRVWADRLPQRARDTLYSYLSRLRGRLAVTGVRLVRQSGGYLLAVDPLDVDLHRFRDLLIQARASGDDARSLAFLEQSLALWRGRPFAYLDTPWLNGLRDTLEQQRLAAELDRNDLALHTGAYPGLLDELSTLAGAHPLNERLAGQVMVALSHCGRPADALAHYDQIRRLLAEALGTDPSPALQDLHTSILRADPTIAPPRSSPGSTALSGQPSLPVPRQLPAAPALFIGRTRELATLTAMLDAVADRAETPVISTIGGAGGIGKTWLALRWSYDNLERFPDGQLYVDLRGYDPSGQPLPSSVAIRGFLDGLGVPAAAIPADLAAQCSLFRSVIADKRLLIILDNARDTAQVVPLLPGGGGCTVLITSRQRLTGLVATHGARPLPIDVLDTTQARQLLRRHLGPRRTDALPAVVTELVELCAGLPLALSIVAARAASQPDFPLQVLVEELRETKTRLDALDAGDLASNLRAVFSSSYRTLDALAARTFGLLGIASGPDISLAGAACLIGLSQPQARPVLAQLHLAHLVREYTPGRYRMHDLVRVYAAETALDDTPEQSRQAAQRRLVDFYLQTAHLADHLLEPHRNKIEIDQPIDGCVPATLDNAPAALVWFDAEYPCLLAAHRLAADSGWHSAVYQLAWALGTYRFWRGLSSDNLTAWRAGLAAANAWGDPVAQARARRLVGEACARVGEYAEGREHLEQALQLTEQIADLPSQVWVLRTLAWMCGRQDDHQRALAYASRALDLCRSIGEPVPEANALNAVGWQHAQLGHFDDAIRYCEQALAASRRHGTRTGEAAALDSLAYVAHQTGQHARALTYYEDALTLFRECGNAFDEAETLARLGDVHSTLGDQPSARHAWQTALDLFQAQYRTEEAQRLRAKLHTQTWES